MGYAIISNHSITCFRGGTKNPMKDLKSIVKNKQGIEYLCKYSKASFDRLTKDQSVEVFDEKGILVKKFLRSFLIFVKDRITDA